jgi:hypothetical protein
LIGHGSRNPSVMGKPICVRISRTMLSASS